MKQKRMFKQFKSNRMFQKLLRICQNLSIKVMNPSSATTSVHLQTSLLNNNNARIEKF